MMAQGGIQAADQYDDSPVIHYLDVIGGGHFDNKPELVEALVKDAPPSIKWLEELGVMFDKNRRWLYDGKIRWWNFPQQNAFSPGLYRSCYLQGTTR